MKNDSFHGGFMALTTGIIPHYESSVVLAMHTDHASAVECLTRHWRQLKKLAEKPRREVEVNHDGWFYPHDLYVFHKRSHLISV